MPQTYQKHNSRQHKMVHKPKKGKMNNTRPIEKVKIKSCILYFTLLYFILNLYCSLPFERTLTFSENILTTSKLGSQIQTSHLCSLLALQKSHALVLLVQLSNGTPCSGNYVGLHIFHGISTSKEVTGIIGSPEY